MHIGDRNLLVHPAHIPHVDSFLGKRTLRIRHSSLRGSHSTVHVRRNIRHARRIELGRLFCIFISW